jgi:DNA adenine methylase
MTTKPTRPILRYFGECGKWRLAPRIIALMPPHRTYVEPFGGAASVLLRKPRVEREVYADGDNDAYDYVRCVRDLGDDLADIIEGIPYTRETYEAAFAPTRVFITDPETDPEEHLLERCWRLTAKSFMSHGSDGFMGRRAGFSDHVLKRNAWKTLPDAIRAAGERLKDVDVRSTMAHYTIVDLDAPDTLFYCDPPYPISTRTGNHGYRTEMTDADHEVLSAQLHSIKGKAMVSGYDCPLYARLYADWRKVELTARKDNAKRAVECVWMNY